MHSRDLQLVLLFSILVVCTARAVGQCQSAKELNISLPADLKCGHVCPRQHGWKMLPVLWAPLEVKINCSSSSYMVLTGHSQQQLVSQATPIKWCGWHQILKDPHVCHFKLSPLQDQYLAVKPSYKGGFLPGMPAFTCVVNSTMELSITAMCLTVLGTLLFFNAGRLTMNEYFRLTSGSLMFMSGAALVLVFVFMRSVPYKRSLAAAFTISGTSVLAIARWFYGTWLPDAHTLLLSRPFLIYMAVTAVLGWGMTHWYDDTTNVKLNNIIRGILQLIGLLMVYMGISDERVAVGAAVVLVSSRGLWAIIRRLSTVLWLSARAVSYVLWLLFRSGKHAVSSTLHRRSRSPTTATPQQQPAPLLAIHETAAHDNGEDLSEHEGVEDEQLLSDEELEASKRRRQHSNRKQGKPCAHVDPVVSGSARSPVHPKQPPPRSPFVIAQQHRAVSVGGWLTAASARGVGEEGYKFPSSNSPLAAHATANRPAGVAAATAARPPWPQETTMAVDVNRRQQFGSATGTPPAKSPWSSEKVAFDVNRRQQLSPQSGNETAGASPWGQQQQQQQSQQRPQKAPEGGGSVSPLVASGKIINPTTGRAILINQTTYNKLVSQGYVPDLQNGVLVAPAGTGEVQAEVASGYRTSPASGVRQRRFEMPPPSD